MKNTLSRTYLNQIPSLEGKQVKIYGFVNTIRHQGGIKFLLLRDVTGVIQCIGLKSNESVFKTLDSLSIESVVQILGKVKAENQAPNGFEVEIESLEVLSRAEPELPIPVVPEKGGGESDITLRLDWRWLDLRTQEKQKIFKVWSALEKGFRETLLEENFTQLYSPAFMSTPSESGADVFEVSYFDRNAYLAQSPQFYKQMGMSAGFERVFMVGPVFRAEKSYTTRHMTEFTGWDFEMSYIDSHHDVMNMEEKALIAAFREVEDQGLVDVEIPSSPFTRISMKDAKKKLAKAGVKSEKEGDLSPEEERGICKLVKDETGSDFVWITDYPSSVRPFYHMRHEDDETLTKSFDLLYRGIEITTGAQREHRYDILIKQANEKGMNIDSLTDYLNFFRYGCPPHGGVGIGPGRIVMQLLDLPSVKEATFLPRDVKRLRP